MRQLYLSNKSKKLIESAHSILKKTNLPALLMHLGHTEIIGSLRLRVMYREDIDLLVMSPKINRAAAENLTSQLVKSEIFNTVSFSDFKKFFRRDTPNGYYWELHIFYENKNWKIDIWYLDEASAYSRYVLQTTKNFEKKLLKHPEKVNLILEIKKHYFDGKKYRNNITGLDIYTAVIFNKIKDTNQFDEYMRGDWQKHRYNDTT